MTQFSIEKCYLPQQQHWQEELSSTGCHILECIIWVDRYASFIWRWFWNSEIGHLWHQNQSIQIKPVDSNNTFQYYTPCSSPNEPCKFQNSFNAHIFEKLLLLRAAAVGCRFSLHMHVAISHSFFWFVEKLQTDRLS